MSRIIFIICIILCTTAIMIISGCGDSSSVIYNPTAITTETPGQTPTNTPPPVQTTSVTGQIKDEAGNPIPGAYIIYYDLTTGQTYTVTADEQGNYKIDNLTPGPCRIEIWRSKSDHDSSPNNPIGAVNRQITAGTNIVNITAGQIEGTPTPVSVTATPTQTPLTSPPLTPAGNCIIDGIVTETERGTPLSGATVSIGETGQLCITDGNGYFSLNVSPGIYTVLVNAENHGQSKAQSVQALPLERTTLEMICMPAVNPSWDNTSPIITGSVNIVTGQITATVTGTYQIQRIKLRIGNKHSYSEAYVSQNNTLNYTVDPASLPPGNVYAYIVAYDLNNNRTELTARYTLPEKQNPALSAPVNLVAQTNTFGEAMSVYKSNINSLMKQGHVPQDFNPDSIKLKNGMTANVSNLPSNASCFAGLWWSHVSGALGYKIYRATNVAGPYNLIGFNVGYTGKWFDGGDFSYYIFMDGDPVAVKPGQTLYYKVAAYDALGDGTMSDPSPAVTVLPVFRVNLQSPANNSTVTTGNPGFTWSYNNVGDQREVDFYIWGRNYNYTSYNKTFSGDTYSYQYETSSLPVLYKNLVYEWDIAACAKAGSNPGVPGGYLSWSYPTWYTSGLHPILRDKFSNNGRFQFTTNIP